MEITRATQVLLENQINGAPVVNDEGRLIGILCQSDLIAQQKKLPIPTVFTLLDAYITLPTTQKLEKQIRKIAAIKVADAMTTEPVTVQSDTRLETVATLMVDNGFHTLPVVEDGRLVGIIGKEDLLRTLLHPPSEQ
jgi:CBS domain-containing protein